MLEFISQPWPWYVAGPLIATVLFLLLYFGGSFGVSSNLRTMCSIAGAGKASDFFRFDWRAQQWNLVFALGGILGGFIAANYLTIDQAVDLSPDTLQELSKLGLGAPGSNYLPPELFGMDQLMSFPGIMLLLLGGFLVGFGARYAGGCTSGHAISGLSNLQWPSLIAVIGFFIGGLVMTHFLLPFLV